MKLSEDAWSEGFRDARRIGDCDACGHTGHALFEANEAEGWEVCAPCANRIARRAIERRKLWRPMLECSTRH